MILLYTVSNGVPIGDAGLNIESTGSSPTRSRRKFRQQWGVIIHKRNSVPLKEKELPTIGSRQTFEPKKAERQSYASWSGLCSLSRGHWQH